jgi:hypothetical protein
MLFTKKENDLFEIDFQTNNLSPKDSPLTIKNNKENNHISN